MQLFLNIIMIAFLICSLGWSIYLKWPQFRVLKKVREFNKKYPNHPTYQAFLVSLATNIGTGNLVGVTSGIILGGPGVIVWMWIFGFLSSSLSYVENIYAIKYQDEINGELRGGACFYILKGLNKPFISLIFAFFLLLTNTIFFPPIQVNTIIISMVKILPFSKYIIGIGVLIGLILIVFRGTSKIIEVTNKIVPVMTISFTTIILFLIAINYHTLLPTIKLILMSAFSFKSMGIAIIINTISVGIRRSLFSHEAGLGTTPSISGMSNPPTLDIQGYFGMLGVYVDTLLLCTITGIFIVQMNLNYSQFEGADLIIAVFNKNLGNIGLLIGVIYLFVFAFASLVGQYYLGESNALFFTKITKIRPKKIIFIYRMVFINGIIIGIIFSTKSVIEMVDLGLIILGVSNLIILYVLEKRKRHGKKTCQTSDLMI